MDFRDLPLQRKLMLIGFAGNVMTFVLIALLLVVQEYGSYRERALISLRAYAAVLSGNVAPALMFADETAASEVLASLAAETTIVHAELHNRKGVQVAKLSRPGRPAPDALPAPGEARFFSGHLMLAHGIDVKDAHEGVLYLQADLRTAFWNMGQRLLLIALALAFALILSSLLFIRLLRRVVDPVQKLAEAMRMVVRDNDYGVRVKGVGHDEIGTLAAGFNQMLVAIHEREAALAVHQAGLEATVAERTEALHQLNASLEKRIRDAVAQNREKDHLLIQQSRLAAMGEMIGSIAHQWRQPINALGLVLSNIRDAWDYGELDAAYLEREDRKGQEIIRHMSTTIDDFRNFFRPDKERVVFDVGTSVDDGLRILEAALRNNQVAVEVTRTGDLRVCGFPNEFSQVVLNLLVNAKEAIAQRNGVDGGWIGIGIAAVEGTVRLTIADDAGGIAPDVLPRIFDPYFTTKAGGSGIGLYMSKMIVEGSMGGHIQADTGVSGAIFTVIVPALVENGAPSAPPSNMLSRNRG